MSSFTEKLKPRLEGGNPTGETPSADAEPAPNPSVEPARQHTASTHNAARKQVDMVSFFYGAESERALPYAYLLDIDRPTPEKICVQFSTCTVVIEGLRLNPVMVALKNHTLADLRASKSPANALGEEPCIQNIAIKNRE